MEVINLHSPIAPAPELAKVRTHEAVAAYLATLPPAPRVLCGDLNTPRRELPDGDVLTFARDSAGRLRPERGERWDAAERALVHDLRQNGWTDAYRALHGYGDRSASWTFANDRGGWRLDHVLVHGLEPAACSYAHEWRRAGLSDHSALVADLASVVSSKFRSRHSWCRRACRSRPAGPVARIHWTILPPRSRKSVRARLPTPEPQLTRAPLRSVRRKVART